MLQRCASVVALIALVVACKQVAANDPTTLRTAEEHQSAQSPRAAGTGQAAQPLFDGKRAWADLERQVAFGPRPSGSPALTQTREYIVSELKKAGIDARQQAFTART